MTHYCFSVIILFKLSYPELILPNLVCSTPPGGALTCHLTPYQLLPSPCSPFVLFSLFLCNYSNCIEIRLETPNLSFLLIFPSAIRFSNPQTTKHRNPSQLLTNMVAQKATMWTIAKMEITHILPQRHQEPYLKKHILWPWRVRVVLEVERAWFGYGSNWSVSERVEVGLTWGDKAKRWEWKTHLKAVI